MFTGILERLARARTTTVPVLGTVGVLALCSGIARAEPPKLIPYGNFPSEGPGVTVDQASGDLFTAGLIKYEGGNFVGIGHLRKFDEAGSEISPPSPFGVESLYASAVVNPANRDLYVLTAAASLETYDPSTGEPVSPSFPVTPSGNLFGSLTIVQIAADATGNVYVPALSHNEVQEYSANGALLATFKGSGAGALKEPSGVAVDASGNLWVADAGNNRIEELSSADEPVAEIKSEGVTSVALGPQGDVLALVENSADPCGSLVPPCMHLLEYSSAGIQLADVGAGEFGNPRVTAGPSGWRLLSMVAANETDGRVYVTDDANNTVWIFGAPSAPKVSRELTAEVSTSEAKLGALVNPGGLETSYRFEYGVTAAYGNSTPFPEGSVGQGVHGRAVWSSANGLAPGTTYHYRVVASNELGTVVGADQTFTTKTAAEASCPNEQVRVGFSAGLPDCRAYEMVTQPNSGSAQADTETAGTYYEGGGIAGNHAALNGARLSYVSAEPLPGADSSGYNYLATRGKAGWSSEDLIPLQSYSGDRCSQVRTEGDEIDEYSADLTSGVLRVGAAQAAGDSLFNGGCGAEGFEIVQGEPLGVQNLLLRDNTTASYRLINIPPAGVTPTDARFQGASVDLSHVIFTENAKLTPDAPAGVEDLYEWDEGAFRLVTVLPNGEAAQGALAQEPAAKSSRSTVISAEGARVFFTATGDLFVRVDGERTVQLDEAHGGSGPGGGGSFQGASADGVRAFFTDSSSAGLTADTVANSGTNLYRYAGGQLSDLTPAEHADVMDVLGLSEDGSYVYFAAEGALPGARPNVHGEKPASGQPNIYLWHEGSTEFIATLRLSDGALNGAVGVSPNGRFFALSTARSLTGYDNVDATNGFIDPEIFLYGSDSRELVCVSCDPSGEPPSAGTVPNPSLDEKGFPGGATLAGPYNGAAGGGSPHYVSNGGRVFFQTKEALLPRDTNRQTDVYEYEGGQLQLISSGTSNKQSVLIDTSENGNDVFFLSHQSLLAQDRSPEELVIYDARVGGGFPESVSPPACTTADACRTPVSPQPSIYGAPSSQTFSGAGNLTPQLRATLKRKAKSMRGNACKRLRKHKRAACEAKRMRRKHRRHRDAQRKANFHKGGK